MEDLIQRLEQAVTRLEHVSTLMQESNAMANGTCINGLDQGKSAPENKFRELDTFFPSL